MLGDDSKESMSLINKLLDLNNCVQVKEDEISRMRRQIGIMNKQFDGRYTEISMNYERKMTKINEEIQELRMTTSHKLMESEYSPKLSILYDSYHQTFIDIQLKLHRKIKEFTQELARIKTDAVRITCDHIDSLNAVTEITNKQQKKTKKKVNELIEIFKAELKKVTDEYNSKVHELELSHQINMQNMDQMKKSAFINQMFEYRDRLLNMKKELQKQHSDLVGFCNSFAGRKESLYKECVLIEMGKMRSLIKKEDNNFAKQMRELKMAQNQRKEDYEAKESILRLVLEENKRSHSLIRNQDMNSPKLPKNHDALVAQLRNDRDMIKKKFSDERRKYIVLFEDYHNCVANQMREINLHTRFLNWLRSINEKMRVYLSTCPKRQRFITREDVDDYKLMLDKEFRNALSVNAIKVSTLAVQFEKEINEAKLHPEKIKPRNSEAWKIPINKEYQKVYDELLDQYHKEVFPKPIGYDQDVDFKELNMKKHSIISKIANERKFFNNKWQADFIEEERKHLLIMQNKLSYFDEDKLIRLLNKAKAESKKLVNDATEKANSSIVSLSEVDFWKKFDIKKNIFEKQLNEYRKQCDDELLKLRESLDQADMEFTRNFKKRSRQNIEYFQSMHNKQSTKIMELENILDAKNQQFQILNLQLCRIPKHKERPKPTPLMKARIPSGPSTKAHQITTPKANRKVVH